jgi:glycerate kinase
MKTTTFGVGELIAHAVKVTGCRNFIIGIGGSATNDGGVGMLTALGFEFLDKNGVPIKRGAEGLEHLSEIRTVGAMKELYECTFSIACDVKNPLCGENGCSAIYGPQKGATAKTIPLMDAWLFEYANLSARTIGTDYSEYPGAGAAGGMGFAFITYLNGRLTSGIELVINVTNLEKKLIDADIVITGEGRLDAQSAMGKAPIGVARAAKKYGKPVIAFAGAIKEDAGVCNEHGIDAFFPILRKPCTLEEAMNVSTAYSNLSDTAEQVFRLFKTINTDLGDSK